MELSLANPAITDKEIADQLGMSRSAVTRRKSGDGYRSIFMSALQNSQQNLMVLMDKAVAELGRSLEDPDPRIRLAAASNIMKHMPEMTKPHQTEARAVVIDLSWADEDEPAEVEYVAKWGDQGDKSN
jgi:transcriptional regulator with XRE-family HTH domain